MKITYGKNLYNNLEISSVVRTLRKTTQMGKSVSNFEKKISKYFGKKYGLMVNSGSSALILAEENSKGKKRKWEPVSSIGRSFVLCRRNGWICVP